MKLPDLVGTATVSAMKTWWNAHYLGTTIKVGPRQFPRVHDMAQRCAKTLGVPPPTVYVANNPIINAMTFGTDDDAVIIIHSAMIDHFQDDELIFVLGHEVGHYHNNHVVYLTLMRLLEAGVLGIFGWPLMPIVVPLRAWYRRAEITCDRAGLLCVGDVAAAERAFLKLACGSQKLYEQMNVDSYLEQLEEGQSSVGRFTESMMSHPYIPKRIQSLRVFAKSHLFRTATGKGGDGLPIEEVDRMTSDIIQIVRENGKSKPEQPAGEGS
jgi:Zn-dependent protease with chaperone function